MHSVLRFHSGREGDGSRVESGGVQYCEQLVGVQARPDEDEALMAYNEHVIGIHQPVWVRVAKELNGEKVSHVVRATAGRIIFNRNIPQDLGFVKRFNEDGTPSDKFFDYEITETCGKKLLGKIVDRTIKQYGFTIAAEVLDNIKATGYKYSTRGSITISIADMTVPKAKYELIDETEKRVVDIEDQYNMGFITDEERYKRVIGVWDETTNKVTDALKASLDTFNPITMMANSGARGSINQIRQLAEQSTKSAVDTRDLIEGSMQEIKEGNQAADSAAASIEIVVDGIGKIAESSRSISEISKDQANAMEQAEQGVNQISEVVQSNSATAEESSATSQELSAQAISLDELISKFILPQE